jgi:hypothetical protein
LAGEPSLLIIDGREEFKPPQKEGIPVSTSKAFRFVPALLLLAASAARADTIDQSFITPTSGGVGLTNVQGTQGFLAQTFTAGMSGNLTGINLNGNAMCGNPGCGPPPIQITIRTVLAGLPTSTILGTTTFSVNSAINFPPNSYGDFPLTQLISFSAPIPLLAGREYAIVVFGPVETSVSLFGAQGNYYTGGRAMSSPDGGLTWQSHDPWDFNFQTHMSPVPEPGTLSLMVTGLAGLMIRRRIKRLNS